MKKIFKTSINYIKIITKIKNINNKISYSKKIETDSLEDGIEFFKKNDFQNALKSFLKSETKDSYFYLGTIYQKGLGVQVDYKKAMEYFKKSGSSMALYNIGYFYENGLGEEINLSRSFEYYKKSNSNFAIAKIASYYENGIEVIQNLDKAMELYEKATNSEEFRGKKHEQIAIHLMNYGMLLRDTNEKEKISKSLELFTRAVTILKQLNNEEILSVCLTELAKSFIMLEDEKNIKEGIEVIQTGFTLQKKLYGKALNDKVFNNMLLLANAYEMLPRTHETLVVSIETYKSALKIKEKSKAAKKAKLNDLEVEDIINIHQKLGFLYGEIKSEKSIKRSILYYDKSFILQKKYYGTTMNLNIAVTLSNIAFSYLLFNDHFGFKMAISYFNKSLNIYDNLFEENKGSNEFIENLIHTYINMGSAYLNLHPNLEDDAFKDALFSLEKALEYAKILYKNENNENYSLIYSNIGSTFNEITNKETQLKAIEYYEKALKILYTVSNDIYNENIPVVLTNLGSAYYKLKGEENLLKSIKYNRLAIEMRIKEKVKIDFNLLNYYNIASIYSELSRNEDDIKNAINSFETILTITYQQEELKTKELEEIINNLLLLYSNFKDQFESRIKELEEMLKRLQSLKVPIDLKKFHKDIVNSNRKEGEEISPISFKKAKKKIFKQFGFEDKKKKKIIKKKSPKVSKKNIKKKK
jgi:TPR repeat protein